MEHILNWDIFFRITQGVVEQRSFQGRQRQFVDTNGSQQRVLAHSIDILFLAGDNPGLGSPKQLISTEGYH